jgi:peptide/nickel transport system ATP-binding protein
VGLNGRWSGEISLGGERLEPAAARRSQEQRRRIQYVFQNPYASLNPRMSIGQNIEEPLKHFSHLSPSDRDEKICEVLDAVALNESYFDRQPDQLSGGERQRAAIARSLIVDPDVLVCDEVTSALDVSVQALVVERLRSLQRSRGLSILFITHNLAVVRSISTSVLVLSQGRVVESGPTASVLDAPQHDYTKRLMADLPRLPTTDENGTSVA